MESLNGTEKDLLNFIGLNEDGPTWLDNMNLKDRGYLPRLLSLKLIFRRYDPVINDWWVKLTRKGIEHMGIE